MVMHQKREIPSGQFLYNDRWVDKRYFRAFVYNDKEQKLANSYAEFESLISSGLWFISRLEAEITIAKIAEEALRVKEAVKEPVKEDPTTNVLPITTKLVDAGKKPSKLKD